MPLRGFTLAEVLITLGIIGVVAALTIPTLISNNNKRIVETRLAKFYSTINQAIELSEVENGPKEKWDTLQWNQSSEEWYAKYLAPYLKTTKVEFSDTNNMTFKVYFPDGSSFIHSAGGAAFYPRQQNAGAGSIKAGRDYFNFDFHPESTSVYYRNKGFEAFTNNWDGTEAMLRNDSTWGCNASNDNKVYCTKLIQENGWKIPDDYPFKF